MKKPFLILQLRPEDEASESEYEAILQFGGLEPGETERIRMEQSGLPDIKLGNYSAVIVGGGPFNISDKEKSPTQKRFEARLNGLLAEIIEKDFPYLGACYGLGALADHLGGEVSKEKYSEEVKATTVNLTDAAKDDMLLKDLPPSFRAFGGHKESCQDVPPNAVLLAGSEHCPIQMIRVKKNVYGTQFHTELDRIGLELRINIYKHAGYFRPEDADKLIMEARKEVITEPEKILRRFIERYSAPV
jgi:GMP synthase (glutamine-hydrolysing)